jgi:hypothetical protein
MLTLDGFVKIDLGDPAAIDAAVARLPAHIDALTNIAGVPGTAPAELVGRVNYLGLRHFTQRVMEVSRISRRDLEQAEILTDTMAEAREAGDHLALRNANRSFHFLFYDRAGIPALARIVEDLWAAYPWDIPQVLSVRVESSLAEHRAIVGAVRDGDLADVKRSVELHVKHSYLALAEHLTGSAQGDPFELDTD